MKFNMDKLKNSKEEIQEENSEKKKKVMLLRIFATIILLFIAGLILFNLGTKKDKDTEKEVTKKMVNQNEDEIRHVIDGAISSENQTSGSEEQEENNSSTNSDLQEISGVSELQINGLNDEVIQYTGNSKERMQNEIHKWLNGYGFAEETAVDFYGECLIDYNTQTVTISFTLNSNPSIGIDYIYNRSNDSVNIVSW